MQTFIAIEGRETGDVYYIDARSFDEALHKKVNAPSRYPDLTGDNVWLPPVKYRTDKAGQPAPTRKES